jgi:PAS domain S-box-containing protein
VPQHKMTGLSFAGDEFGPADLQLLIDTIPALIHTSLPDGYLDYFNQRWLDYLGVPLENIEGWKWTGSIHPDDVAGIVDKWRSCLASGEIFEHECRVRRADGEYRWMVHRKLPLRDGRGEIVKWYGSSLDIEDRRRTEQALEKAFRQIERLKDQLYKENIALREEVDKASMFEEIVGASRALHAVLGRAAKVAPTDSTVLITGETGTGKELIARAIHKRSPRNSRAFVSVNCAAIPKELIASELFGHERGAFTGAIQRHLGRFELADGGTIFLDEIGDLPADTQIALLRVLQEKEFERVGGVKPIPADVRVIAATNHDLQADVASSVLRSDLFYRLNVFPIEIPPLRERREDIGLLVEYFIRRYASKAGKHFHGVSKEVLDVLKSYSWPGNIRELQNVIERSVIVCESGNFFVDESWLPRAPSPSFGKRTTMQQRKMIEEALAEAGGRVSGPSGAAAKLALPSTTLESKIRSLRINKYRFKTAGPQP